MSGLREPSPGTTLHTVTLEALPATPAPDSLDPAGLLNISACSDLPTTHMEKSHWLSFRNNSKGSSPSEPSSGKGDGLRVLSPIQGEVSAHGGPHTQPQPPAHPAAGPRPPLFQGTAQCLGLPEPGVPGRAPEVWGPGLGTWGPEARSQESGAADVGSGLSTHGVHAAGTAGFRGAASPRLPCAQRHGPGPGTPAAASSRAPASRRPQLRGRDPAPAMPAAPQAQAAAGSSPRRRGRVCGQFFLTSNGPDEAHGRASIVQGACVQVSPRAGADRPAPAPRQDPPRDPASPGDATAPRPPGPAGETRAVPYRRVLLPPGDYVRVALGRQPAPQLRPAASRSARRPRRPALQAPPPGRKPRPGPAWKPGPAPLLSGAPPPGLWAQSLTTRRLS
nr:basic proline-rich protein-like [Marmota flaviventris]